MWKRNNFSSKSQLTVQKNDGISPLISYFYKKKNSKQMSFSSNMNSKIWAISSTWMIDPAPCDRFHCWYYSQRRNSFRKAYEWIYCWRRDLPVQTIYDSLGETKEADDWANWMNMKKKSIFFQVSLFSIVLIMSFAYK